MALQTLLKLAAADEKENDNGNGWGASKGKDKGSSKGKGKGKANYFVNENGEEQQKCWDFEEWGECWKRDCFRAHVDPRTGKNGSPPKPGAGGKGAGKGGGTGGGGAAPAAPTATTTQGSERRIIGGPKPAEAPAAVQTPAQALRDEVQGALIDPEGMEAKGVGVEVAIRVDLTTAGELTELDAQGRAKNTVIAVDRLSKIYLLQIKEYINSRAKRGTIEIGEVGVQKIHEAMMKLFEAQVLSPDKAKKIPEDAKIEVKDDLLGNKDPTEAATVNIGDMLKTTLETVLGVTGKTRAALPVASPVRKRVRKGKSPTKVPPGGDPKRTAKLDELRKRLTMDSEEGDDDEDDDAENLPSAGPLSEEEMLNQTAEIILVTITAVEGKMEELGRTGDSKKTEFDATQPLKDIPMDYVATGASGSAPVTLTPANFDEVTKWTKGQFVKEDLEKATDQITPGLLAATNNLKRAADVITELAKSHGYIMKGPKRVKMMVIMISFILARKAREAN